LEIPRHAGLDRHRIVFGFSVDVLAAKSSFSFLMWDPLLTRPLQGHPNAQCTTLHKHSNNAFGLGVDAPAVKASFSFLMWDPLPTRPLQGHPNAQCATLHKRLNNGDLEQRFCPLSNPFHLNCLLHSLRLQMRQQPTSDSIQLSTASGFAVCDGLLRMAHCLMTALPEPELRNIRFTLGALTARADHLLESTEFDLALNFDNLAVDAGKSCAPSRHFRTHLIYFREPLSLSGGRRLWRDSRQHLRQHHYH